MIRSESILGLTILLPCLVVTTIFGGLGWPLHISCNGIVPVWGGCRIIQELFHRNLRELDFAARGFVKSAPFD